MLKNQTFDVINPDMAWIIHHDFKLLVLEDYDRFNIVWIFLKGSNTVVGQNTLHERLVVK